MELDWQPYYRVVEKCPTVEGDFVPQGAQGLPPSPKSSREQIRRWNEAISVWTDPRQAIARAAKDGQAVATLNLSDCGLIAIQRGHPAHFDIEAAPDAINACVVDCTDTDALETLLNV